MEQIFARNKAWVASVNATEPGFFPRLAAQQSPRYFWIGCSDSRVPANVVAGLDPGEVFVHRNVANVVHSSDMNMLATLEYAVETLKVRHVIVCGHYGCGGVRASLAGRTEGLSNHWVEPIRRLNVRHEAALRGLPEERRLDRLAELNVTEGVGRVAETPILRAAWGRGQPVEVHGLIYSIQDGLLRDLGCSCGGPITQAGAG